MLLHAGTDTQCTGVKALGLPAEHTVLRVEDRQVLVHHSLKPTTAAAAAVVVWWAQSLT